MISTENRSWSNMVFNGLMDWFQGIWVPNLIGASWRNSCHSTSSGMCLPSSCRGDVRFKQSSGMKRMPEPSQAQYLLTCQWIRLRENYRNAPYLYNGKIDGFLFFNQSNEGPPKKNRVARTSHHDFWRDVWEGITILVSMYHHSPPTSLIVYTYICIYIYMLTMFNR